MTDQEMQALLEKQKQVNEHKKRRKKDYLAIIITLVVLLVAAPSCYVVGNLVYTMARQQGYIDAFSESAAYGSEQGTVIATKGELSREISSSKNLELYNLLTTFSNSLVKKLPDRAADIVLEYGDGAVLELWDSNPGEGNNVMHRAIWRFTSPTGKVWKYTSNGFQYSHATKLLFPKDGV